MAKKVKKLKKEKNVDRKTRKIHKEIDADEFLANLEKRKSEAAQLADQIAILRKPSAMIFKEETEDIEISQQKIKELEPKATDSKYDIGDIPEDMEEEYEIDSDEEEHEQIEKKKKRKKEKKVRKTRIEIMREKELAKEDATKKEKEPKMRAGAKKEIKKTLDQKISVVKFEKTKKSKKVKTEKKETKRNKKETRQKDSIKKEDKLGAEILYWEQRLNDSKKIAVEIGIELTTSIIKLTEGPKKKLSKKERAKLTAEAAEKQRLEVEAQARRLEELIQKKKEEERLAAIEKDKQEIIEQKWRMEQLEYTNALMEEIVEFNKEVNTEEADLMEWEKYVACGKLPNSKMCDQMNTYLHLWEKEMDSSTVEKASGRTKDVVQLLGELDELIDTDVGQNGKKLENLKWVRSLFRNHQATSLDVATYTLLRDVEHNLNRINIPTADFNFKDDYVTLCIWLRVMLPIPLPNPRRPPKPRIDVTFDLMEANIVFPMMVDCENAAIRVMFVKYDHLSDLSDSFNLPMVPEEYHMDLMKSSKKEWSRKLKYKYDNRDIIVEKPKEPIVKENSENQENLDSASNHSDDQKSIKDNDGANIQKEEEKSVVLVDIEVTSDTEDIPIVPYKLLKPTASELAVSKEDTLYTETRSRLKLELEDHVINLRKYMILGGMYHINYLAQPPQPQEFISMDMTITTLSLPKKLETIPFEVTYTTPPPEDPNVRRLPEEIEEDMKKQEEELDKLISVSIKWPQHVIFLELPIVCQWDETTKQWSKKSIYDLKHNEEKCTLSFRTGVFGIFGLAAYRYANLPFQAYDIKPEADDSLTVQLTAAILMLEFNIKNGLICITQLQNSPNMALQDVVGQYFKFHRLKRMMKDAGIDIFPSLDSFCYVEASCEKQWAMESHLYENMSLMANCFNFAWSRWNLQSGRRKIVFQMRDYIPTKAKQKNHQMVLVTPLKASFIDCTEVSAVFSDKEVESSKFCADLYHLMKNTSGIFIRNKVLKACKKNVDTLAQFLKSMRILSFS